MYVIKMSDINDDLLNYELGDDIIDDHLYGADEDELLLSDEDLEKNVTATEKQRLRAEEEQWALPSKENVQTKIQNQDSNGLEDASTSVVESAAVIDATLTASAPNEVTYAAPTGPSASSAACDNALNVETTQTKSLADFKQLLQQKELAPEQENVQALLSPKKESAPLVNVIAPHSIRVSNADEVSSSSNKTLVLDSISYSTKSTDTSLFMQSPQERSIVGIGSVGESSDFSDPREDLEEREERTNIKTLKERESESTSSGSPEKYAIRFAYAGGSKRMAGNALLRRTLPYNIHPRPIMRFVPPHGHFMPSQPTTHNPYTPPPPVTQQQQHVPVQNSANTPNAILHTHPLDAIMINPSHSPRMRHPFGNFIAGPLPSFLHANNAGMYPQVPDHSGQARGRYIMNFGQNSRNMFRINDPISLRNMRPQHRPPLQAVPLHITPLPNYVNNAPLRIQPQPTTMPMQQPTQTSVLAKPIATTAAGQQSSHIMGTALPNQSRNINSGTLRPGKVLINPNFKGGVEAATNKFIQETQFMATISSHVSHLQSDDELLRQQEEFINKNRQHIEKRRNEPRPVRRSRTRSRSPRSLTPQLKRSGGGSGGTMIRDRTENRPERSERAPAGVAERDRGRAGSRERDRDRGNVNNRCNRFRRGNSRDRDLENRSSIQTKRRRSFSPSTNRGSGAAAGRRGGANSGNRDVEEDEETRNYRLEIEKQKAMREKILKDKELKRRRAAEEKLIEDKRTTQFNNSNPSNSSGTNEDQQQKQLPPAQKLKPLIVTEPKMISLKKRQQRDVEEKMERYSNLTTSQQHQQQHQHQHQQQQQQQQRKHVPTAKILPEAKRTLTKHLTNATIRSGCGSNTAIVKPVPKKDNNAETSPAPVCMSDVLKQQRQTHCLSTPSDDEVQLDYDEDELMLDEEDRLLATPTPSPTRPASGAAASRTPTPEPQVIVTRVVKNRARQKPLFASNNRRVLLKSTLSTASISTTAPTAGGGGGGGGGNTTVLAPTTTTVSGGRRDVNYAESAVGSSISKNVRRRDNYSGTVRNNSVSSSNIRKGIFDRLDARRQVTAGSSSSSSSAANKRNRAHHRGVLLKRE